MRSSHFFLTLIISLLLIPIFSIILPLSLNAAEPTGLVTCGLMGAKTLCNICDLITLFQTLVNKANSYFALPLAALMLGYGGLLMVISGFQGGNAGLYTKGKKVLTNTLIGIVIIFCSWLAIDTLLKTVGAYQHATSSNFGPWHEIECTSPAIKLPTHFACVDNKCEEVDGFARSECSTDFNCTEKAHFGCRQGMCTRIDNEIAPNTCTVSPDNCPPEHYICRQGSCTVTTADVVDDCKPLNGNDDCKASGISIPLNKKSAEDLKAQGVVFSSSGDCWDASGNKVSANTNLQEMLREEPLTVCHAGCKTDGKPCLQKNITVDHYDVMSKLAEVRRRYGLQFTVNSFTTGDHELNSDHYQGKAVDISAVGGTTYADLKAQLEPKLFNGIRLAQCENEKGKVVADCGPSTKHLHVSYN